MSDAAPDFPPEVVPPAPDAAGGPPSPQPNPWLAPVLLIGALLVGVLVMRRLRATKPNLKVVR
jgi:hypothetical protein